MARGWESKSVEAQVESAETTPVPVSNNKLDPTQAERLRHKTNLVLSRKRIIQELEQSAHPRHRQMLSRALADLDRRLTAFD